MAWGTRPGSRIPERVKAAVLQRYPPDTPLDSIPRRYAIAPARLARVRLGLRKAPLPETHENRRRLSRLHAR
jgi:hypothetical protein